MHLPYQFFIAIRYLRSKRRLRGISINTFISIAGVALGVMTLVIVISVMDGFHEDLRNKILGVNAHIVVQSYEGTISDVDSLREAISDIPGVVASSPFVLGQVMLRHGQRAQGVVIKGIDPDIETNTTDVLKNLKEGKLDNLKVDSPLPGIIVGSELMRNLGLFYGEEVEVLSPLSEIGPLGMIPRMKKYRLVGYFEAGMYEYDSSLAFINIRDAQDFFNLQDGVSGLEVKIDDIYRAPDISREIERRIGPPYYARDWMQMNRNLFSALKLEKIVMFIILTLIILVASFNIISNLIMTVIEKSREIAILRAMGATGRGIMSIFIIHGLVIGVVGTLIGIVSGYITCQLLKTYRFISLPPDIYYLSYLPVKIDLFDFFIVSISAIFISFLATVYPSYQAARLDPVEPLRYE
jgi:lipoprotein-releasing system permease protein